MAKSEVAVPTGSPTERFLAEATTEPNADPRAATEQIMRSILDAETADAVLAPRTGISAETYLAKPFTLLTYDKMPSTFADNTIGFYYLLHGATPDGEPVTISAGAVNVMAAVWRLNDLGQLPARVQIVQSDKPTAAGYWPLSLVAVTDF